MIQIVGIRFKPAGKVYHFSSGNLKLAPGDHVIVETARSVEMGKVVVGTHAVERQEGSKPLKPVLRAATKEDLALFEKNRTKEKEAFAICLEKIKKHKLDMKLIEVEYTFDGSKILFYFTADGRIDFRELVKDLANVFRTRIELRQIGVRDESKTIGSYGICGRSLCCSQFLGEFEPVSIKMAKEQGLSLNPTKISGVCGRLMCCLKYEQDAYEDLLRVTPRVGSTVRTPVGKGVVEYVNILKGLVKVKVGDDKETALQEFHTSELKVLKRPSRDAKEDKIDESLKHLE